LNEPDTHAIVSVPTAVVDTFLGLALAELVRRYAEMRVEVVATDAGDGAGAAVVNEAAATVQRAMLTALGMSSLAD
jgi:hypothetical protein